MFPLSEQVVDVFVDGEPTPTVNVVHTFPRAGVFTITATVTDTQGIVGTSLSVVNVNQQSTIPVTMTATRPRNPLEDPDGRRAQPVRAGRPCR